MLQLIEWYNDRRNHLSLVRRSGLEKSSIGIDDVNQMIINTDLTVLLSLWEVYSD